MTRRIRSTLMVIGLERFLAAYEQTNCSISAGPPPRYPRRDASAADWRAYRAAYEAWTEVDDDRRQNLLALRDSLIEGLNYNIVRKCPATGAHLSVVALETVGHDEEEHVLVIQVSGYSGRDQTQTCKLLARAGGRANPSRSCGHARSQEPDARESAFLAGFDTVEPEGDYDFGVEDDTFDFERTFEPLWLQHEKPISLKLLRENRRIFSGRTYESSRSVRWDTSLREKKTGGGHKRVHA